MSSVTFRQSPSFAAPSFRWLSRLRDDEPLFFGLGVLLLAAMPPTAFAMIVDSRTFLGVDVWLKPLKFELALVIYLWTLAFFARWIPVPVRAARWYRVYAGIVVFAIVAEMLWIGGAAMLGAASHFNTSPVGGVIYPLMGLMALVLTSPTAVYAWLIARNPATGLPPALKEAVVTGLALVLPLTLVTAGTLSQMGGHFIGGAASDLGGLPLMGWARDGGDLRVAHFFATHALHIVPALGVLSVLVFGRDNRAPVRLFALLFMLFVGFTYVQALQGRPFLPWIG